MPRRNSTPPMKVTPKAKVRKTRTIRKSRTVGTCKDCLQVERVDSDDPSLMLGPEEPKAAKKVEAGPFGPNPYADDWPDADECDDEIPEAGE